MSYLLFAWTASVASALVVIVAKLTTKRAIKNPWLFNFLWSIVVVLFVTPLAILNHASIPEAWMPILLTGISSAAFYIFYSLAIYRLDVSTLSPLFNFRTIFAVIIGIIFLQEYFTVYQYVLIGVVIIAGIFATMDEKFSLKSFFNPSIGIAMLAMIALAINNASIKWASAYNDVWTVNMWSAVVGLIAIVPTIPLFAKELPKLKPQQIAPIGLMGLFQTLTNFALTSALAVNVGITSIIMSIPLSMIFAVLFSIFAPKLLEKHTAKIYLIR